LSAWLVNIGGLVAVGLIIWWFWLSRPRAQRAVSARPIEIIVDNGVYTPARIEVPAGKRVTLRFIRKDPSPCAEKVLFDDLDISADLPVGRPYDVSFTPDKVGEHDFTCQMRMYRGSLVVRET
jgi:plastocyanin domain-containing protein